MLVRLLIKIFGNSLLAFCSMFLFETNSKNKQVPNYKSHIRIKLLVTQRP